MKTSTEPQRTHLYLLLLSIQGVGAVFLIWQQLPEFRQVLVHPGEQISHDGLSDFMTLAILCVMQFAFWHRVRNITIPFRQPKLVLHHLLLFLGRLSFIFGGALFSVVVFRHLPALDPNMDILLAARRGIVVAGCLFTLFCASLEVERLARAFEPGRDERRP
jgi:hypothetical protein